MSVFKAILLGIIQGITEFLPVSSSGHLSLGQHFLGVSGEGSLLFSVMLHLGTLAAVFIVYYKTIWNLVLEAIGLLKDIFGRRFSFRKLKGNRRMLVMFFFSCIPLLILLLPTGNDMLLIDRVKVFSEDTSILAEGFCFLFTGALLLSGIILSNRKKAHNSVSPGAAVVIGIAQTLAAAFPGISRSGSTISAGMACGVAKQHMIQYSFILGIPAILAANVFEFKDAVESGERLEALPVFLGIITAAVVGVICIKLLQWIMKKDMFKYFGFYCLVLGIIVVIIGIIEKTTGVYVGVR